MAALDLYNGLLGCAARSVNEIHKAVYTFVCAFASILASRGYASNKDMAQNWNW
jgi:hypothetical protein